MSVQPVLMTAAKAAETLGLSVREVRRLVNAGELDVKYIGEHNSTQYRVTYASIVAYADALPSEKKVKR